MMNKGDAVYDRLSFMLFSFCFSICRLVIVVVTNVQVFGLGTQLIQPWKVRATLIWQRNGKNTRT